MSRTLTVNTAVPIVLATMLAGRAGGHVINLTDAHVDLPCHAHLPYDVAKAALTDATRRLARLLAPAVRVNAVAPSLVHGLPGEPPAVLNELAARAPLPRPVAAAEVVAAVRYLCDARSLTGQIIAVDNGAHLVGDIEAPIPARSRP